MRKSVRQSDPARRFGFTLIELLVVVAIIGLLLSILMPSLASAREQARTTKCIANLKSIGTTMNMYFGENREWFPFERRNWPNIGSGGSPGSGWPLSAFHYGGHPGKVSTWNFTKYLQDTFRGRPFNPYMYDNLLDRLETIEEESTAEFWERRKPFSVYACPSDNGAAGNNNKFDDTGNYTPTHQDYGTSYDMNYHFVWLWAAGAGGLGPPNSPYMGGTQGSPRPLYLERANKFLQHQRARGHGSRFVILYEDRFDFSQYQRLQSIGWHKKLNRHSVLFLDGHAANMSMDTRQTNGPGWKTSSGTWFNNPEDPDYDLRTIMN